MKEIIENDVAKLKELSLKVLKEDHFQSIERLGGMTNHSYRVQTPKHDVVFRIPGEGTEAMINRENEIIANKLASQLDIDTQLLYIDTKGHKVSPYIKDAITMDSKRMSDPTFIRLAAEVLKKLHQCQVNTNVQFDIKKTAFEYEECIKNNGVAFFDDYAKYQQVFFDLYEQFHLPEEKLVPCHNDPLCENWIYSNHRMYLIDWEYAGMNDPLWDLADLSIEAGFNHEQDRLLLSAYDPLNLNPDMWQRFYVNKVFIDYLWSLWGLARLPYDASLLAYGQARYERMKQNLKLVKQA